MVRALTAPARLGLLLPWLNGNYHEDIFQRGNPEPVAVKTDYDGIRQALADFLGSFDGSLDAGHLEVGKKPASPTDDDVDEIEARLRILIEQGFDGAPTTTIRGVTTLPALLFLPVTSLRFAVRNAGRAKPARKGGRVSGGVTAVRNYRAAGAYVLQVEGPMLELVPFLVAHLLTAPDMASVKRCERQGCPHFVITATAKRGRPQRFCSAGCREWNRELEQQRIARRRNS